MGFGIDRRARSRKARGGIRALLGKAPDAREVGDRLVRLTRRMFKGGVLDASPKRITIALHPAAPPIVLVVLPDGDLEVRAETATVGPGYHAEILDQLAGVLDELEFAWDGDEPDPQGAMTQWLATEL
nr:hypothetical protein [Deltaproteobacteria bacterium]